MTPEEIKGRIFKDELKFSTSRSAGPGGQNVNKVNTKIELRFNVIESDVFSGEEKALLIEKLGKKINRSGELIIRSQSQRTQSGNRNRAVEKLLMVLAGALTEDPERIKTSPTRQSVTRRLDEKRRHAGIKRIRSKKDIAGETE